MEEERIEAGKAAEANRISTLLKNIENLMKQAGWSASGKAVVRAGSVIWNQENA